MDNNPADDVPFTSREAAEHFRVARSTIRQWVRRYRIEPAGSVLAGNGQPAPTYRFGDLVRAERLTRTSKRGGRPRVDRLSPARDRL